MEIYELEIILYEDCRCVLYLLRKEISETPPDKCKSRRLQKLFTAANGVRDVCDSGNERALQLFAKSPHHSEFILARSIKSTIGADM